jgi:hypothetical protein
VKRVIASLAAGSCFVGAAALVSGHLALGLDNASAAPTADGVQSKSAPVVRPGNRGDWDARGKRSGSTDLGAQYNAAVNSTIACLKAGAPKIVVHGPTASATGRLVHYTYEYQGVTEAQKDGIAALYKHCFDLFEGPATDRWLRATDLSSTEVASFAQEAADCYNRASGGKGVSAKAMEDTPAKARMKACSDQYDDVLTTAKPN